MKLNRKKLEAGLQFNWPSTRQEASRPKNLDLKRDEKQKMVCLHRQYPLHPHGHPSLRAGPLHHRQHRLTEVLEALSGLQYPKIYYKRIAEDIRAHKRYLPLERLRLLIDATESALLSLIETPFCLNFVWAELLPAYILATNRYLTHAGEQSYLT